ncbi:MAG: hypothetical protein PVG49_20965 [Desulfobacteraceae bacterium]
MKTLPPSRQSLDRIIKKSVQVQKYREVYTPHGRSMTILAAWWHPETGVIFKTNDREQVVVTVFTKDIREEKKKRARQ